MVKLIMGLSGSGKTKTLISLVSEAIEKEQGNVVCIEKSRHLTYDIPYQARLIRTDDYGVRGNTMLLGFLCGLHAGNYDITHFFIDDLNKILDDRSNEALEKFLDTLSVAQEACDGGHVSVGGRVAKPSTDVKVGDVIEIRFGAKTLRAEVLSVQETVKKDDAAAMYREL